MDGWVVIGVDLESKNFDAEIKNVENQLKKLEQKQKVLQKYNKLNDKLREGKPDAVLQWTEKSRLELEKFGLTTDDIGNKNTWQKLSAQIETLANKYVDLNKKQMGLKNVEEDTNNINLNLDKTVKKIGRWALAMFGIRSAYGLIRRAISSVSQYNEQIGADINYMSMALASILEPIVQRIVNLAHTLLTYVAYIIKAWTGQNIFKNANKYLQKSVGSAKQLNKELAGFDEMNVLGNSSTGGVGGALPSFNLANPEDVPIPSWIKWIADNKDDVIGGLAGIAGGLGAIKMGFKPLQSLGIGLALDGIVSSISAIQEFIKDPNFSHFIDILVGIGKAVAGVGIALGSLPVAVAGIAVLIVALVLKNYDKIVDIFNKALDWLKGPFRDKMVQLFGPFGDIIVNAIARPIEAAKALFEGFFGGIKRIINGIIKMFKGDFKGGLIEVFGGIKSIMLAPLNAFIQGINSLLKGINRIKIKAPSWVPLIGGKELWSVNIPLIPRLAKGGIINMPGRGVNYAGANIGERAPEGIIPLTDSQQMEWLGREIGKNVTINATVINTMNGRVISRELQKVQNASDFAYNR